MDRLPDCPSCSRGARVVVEHPAAVAGEDPDSTTLLPMQVDRLASLFEGDDVEVVRCARCGEDRTAALRDAL